MNKEITCSEGGVIALGATGNSIGFPVGSFSFSSIYIFLFPISLVTGALGNGNRNETIFSIESAIVSTVMSFKLFHIIWKQSNIIELLHRICVFSVERTEQLVVAEQKLKKFIQFVTVYLTVFFVATLTTLIVPFIGNERKFMGKFAFPFDWRNNEIAFWMAFIYLCFGIFLMANFMLFTAIIWYLLANCFFKYEVLGNQLRTMGCIKKVRNNRKVLESKKQNVYFYDLIEGIESLQPIRK